MIRVVGKNMSTYVNNRLKHVIIKVDFNNMLPIDDNLPKDVLEVAHTTFPLLEPIPASHSEIRVSSDGAKVTNVEQGINWIFYGTNKEKALSIKREGSHREKTSISIDYFKYKSFDVCKEEFISIFNKFIEVFPESQIGRVGLRYVNNIDINEKNPLNWTKYINANLLSSLKFVDDRKFISRVFNNLEMKYDDMSIKFQYGMHNPDYPSPIKKKIFILDYDVYYIGELVKSEVPVVLERYHDQIISLFERSIKDGLRDKLNE
jgi:uncharacterized protein (TIGR04255 family)